MVKKCPNCQAKNKDEARYCSACGASITSAQTRPKPVPVVTVLQPTTRVGVGLPISPVTVSPLGMCAYHRDLRAVYVCSACGRSICRDCAKAYADLILCPFHYREVVPTVPTAPPSAPVLPTALSLIGGMLVLVCTLGIMVSPLLAIFAILMWLVTEIPIGWVVILGVLAGFAVIAGAMVSYQPGYETMGGAIVMLFSILGLLAGGGFIVGFILGLIGGMLSVTRK